MSSPNFFDILDLDPAQPWDEEQFQRVLRTKRAEWTKRARHPKYATLYNSYLEMVPKIKAVMSDPELRQQEANAALALRQERGQDQQKQFDEQLELLTAKGFVTEDDIQTLVATYSIDESQVRQTLKQRKIQVRAGTANGQDNALAMSTMDTIQTQLQLLNKRDLYDFLGIAETSATSDLLEAARRIYNETLQKASKTAEVTATSVLAGQAMRIFESEDERQKYDRARELLPYEQLLAPRLSNLLQGPDKTLYAGQFQMLLALARTEGLDADTAERYIRQRARRMGAVVEVADFEAIKQQRRCPNCGTLSQDTARNCPTCGTPLESDCPGCGQTILTEHNACPHCGFPIGELFIIQHMLDDAADLATEQRYDLAEEKFRSAQHIWTKLPSRSHSNAITQELEALMAEAEEDLAWMRQQMAALQSMIDEKRFYAARDTLREIEAEWGPLKDERQQIETAIAHTEERLKLARAATGDEAVQLYVEILADCADCEPAREALERIPPSAPGELTIRQSNQVVNLEWTPSPSDSVRYTVVRKAHSRPVSVNDGTVLATVAGIRYDDTSPVVGVPLYYGVYADRGGVPSDDASFSKNPVLLVRGVSNLTAQVNDQEVYLSWEAPESVEAVLVVRSGAGNPRSPKEGEAVHTLDKTQVIDKDLQNGKTYYYGVFCQYVDHKGQIITSPGAFVSATPQVPPSPITEMQIEVVKTGAEHELLLSWEPPEKGQVVVVSTTRPPSFDVGWVVDEQTLSSEGEIIYGGPGEIGTVVEAARIVYFTPVVLFGGMAYIGKTVDYASLEDVSNVRVQNLGAELQLRWEWPRNCQKVIVAYSHSEYPTARDDTLRDVVRIELTKAQYDLRGYHAIPDPKRRDYYVVVFAVISQGGTELLASGRESRLKISLSSSMTVQYEINRRRRMLVGRGELVLTVNVEGEGHLPGMVLVRKQTALPLTRSDGEIIYEIAAQTLESQTTRLQEPLPENAEQPRSYARLFLVDDESYESRGGHVRIVHPPQDKLRVF